MSELIQSSYELLEFCDFGGWYVRVVRVCEFSIWSEVMVLSRLARACLLRVIERMDV